MVGRKPVPTAALKMRGSWRAKTRPHEPAPEPGRPRRPPGLDPAARRKWDELVPRLEKLGVLTAEDGEALALFCVSWSQYWVLRRFIAKHGHTYELNGRRWGYPEVQMAAQLAMYLLRLEQEFGLTPSARTRIQVSKKSSSSSKAALFRTG